MSFNWENLETILSQDLYTLRATVSNLDIKKRCTADFTAVRTLAFSNDHSEQYTARQTADNITEKNGHLGMYLGKYCTNSCNDLSESNTNECVKHFNIDPFSNEGYTFKIIPHCFNHTLVYECVLDFNKSLYPWKQGGTTTCKLEKGCYNYYDTLLTSGFLD